MQHQHQHHSRRGSKQPRFYPVTKEAEIHSQDEPRKRKTRHSLNPPMEMHVGWVMDSRDHQEFGGSGSNRRDSFSDSVGSFGSR